VYSGVAGLALAISILAWGGRKAAPVGIAPAPLSFRAPASRTKLFGANWLNFEHVPIARSAVLDCEGPDERNGRRSHQATRSALLGPLGRRRMAVAMSRITPLGWGLNDRPRANRGASRGRCTVPSLPGGGYYRDGANRTVVRP
jgi:hypothetical protein